MVCAFVFIYAKRRFSHDVAQIILQVLSLLKLKIRQNTGMLKPNQGRLCWFILQFSLILSGIKVNLQIVPERFMTNSHAMLRIFIVFMDNESTIMLLSLNHK